VVMKTRRHVVILAASARTGSSGTSATAEIHFSSLQRLRNCHFCEREKNVSNRVKAKIETQLTSSK
jgi:hypothetical protein